MGTWACEWSASTALGMLGHYLEPEINWVRDRRNSKEQTCILPKAAMYKRSGFPLHFAFIFCITGGGCIGNNHCEIAFISSFPTTYGGLKQEEKEEHRISRCFCGSWQSWPALRAGYWCGLRAGEETETETMVPRNSSSSDVCLWQSSCVGLLSSGYFHGSHRLAFKDTFPLPLFFFFFLNKMLNDVLSY